MMITHMTVHGSSKLAADTCSNFYLISTYCNALLKLTLPQVLYLHDAP